MASITPNTSENEEEKVTTIIADDLEIQGSVKFKTSLMVKGIINGDIISEGLLIVGPTAKVMARITTKSLISRGEIEGDVDAGEQVVLKNTAVHNGNITTPYIVIESGSVFNGSCVMNRETPVKTPDTFDAVTVKDDSAVIPATVEQTPPVALDEQTRAPEGNEAAEEKEEVLEITDEKVEAKAETNQQEPAVWALDEQTRAPEGNEAAEEKEEVLETTDEKVEAKAETNQQEPAVEVADEKTDGGGKQVEKEGGRWYSQRERPAKKPPKAELF